MTVGTTPPKKSAAATRRASVRAYAKINPELRVLSKRSDGYHELRAIFQTISLADRIDIALTPARRLEIQLDDALRIPDNLAARAAHAAMSEMRLTGLVEIALQKTIPMGAGLGGGSSDAAAVLLALPPLAGGIIALPRLGAIAQQLGSDVPFFLMGGAAVGIGRGTELFPLPDVPSRAGLIVTPGIHVSTAAAYAALSPGLTSESEQNKIFSFQSRVWGEWCAELGVNDFETVAFQQHPGLSEIKRLLLRAGASQALMTGSGSAVFGLFRDRREVSRAVQLLKSKRPDDPDPRAISIVSRTRYRSLWLRALKEHISGKTWPPRSRYVR